MIVSGPGLLGSLKSIGILCGSGIGLNQYQEVGVRASARTLAQRYVQFTARNTTGRCQLKSITPSARAGQRRAGILI